MAKGFKCGTSGGAINFTVKAYPSEVELNNATASENTIGVVTTKEITSWVFSATEPTEPVDGMLWIDVGESSGVEFNLVKKNAIYIYPLFASQYIDGAWVELVAYTYRNEEWTQWWDGTIYTVGNTYELYTGGWEALPFPERYPGSGAAPTITIVADGLSVYLSAGSNVGGKAQTKKPIDFTPFSTLFVRYNASISGAWSGNEFRIYSATSGNQLALLGCKQSSNVEGNLDISAIAEKCYLAIGLGTSGENATGGTSRVVLKYARLLK